MASEYALVQILEKKAPTPLDIDRTSSFTQSYEYGTWQERLGRKVYRFQITKKDRVIGTFQAIEYPLIFNKKYLYIPHGPVVAEKLTPELAIFLSDEFNKILTKTNTTFIRFDIFPKTKDGPEDKILAKYFTPTPTASYYSAFFQSKYDWQLTISPTENELLANMHSKTRYCINLSQKKDLTVLQVSGKQMMEHFERFYELMLETSIRGKFHLHPKEYYRAIFKSAETDPSIVLFVAKYQETTLATHLMIFYGDTAFYPFGASTRNESDRMPAYALHWSAIREGKKRGCLFYNFGAIATGEKIARENWDGISAFKRKFGGSVFEYSDFYDCVKNKPIYWLYNLRKKVKRI